MKVVSRRVRDGATYYAVLKRDGRPVVIEEDRTDAALRQGAELYPEAGSPDRSGCIEVPDEHYRILKEAGWLED